MTTISRSLAKARSASGHFSRISRTVMVFIALYVNMFHKGEAEPPGLLRPVSIVGRHLKPEDLTDGVNDLVS